MILVPSLTQAAVAVQVGFRREMNVTWEFLTVSCAILVGLGSSKLLTIFVSLNTIPSWRSPAGCLQNTFPKETLLNV